MGPYGTSTDPYPEVGSSPYPKKTTWTSQSSRYGRTPRSIPYRRTYVGARHAGRMRTTRPITTSRFTSQMMSRGLVNMVSSPTARTRRRARPVGRALTSSVSYCDSSGFPDRPVMTAGTSADGRVPGVDRRGIAGWSSAAQRPPTSEVPYLLLLMWTTSSPRYRRHYAPTGIGARSRTQGGTDSYRHLHSGACPIHPRKPRAPPSTPPGRSIPSIRHGPRQER